MEFLTDLGNLFGLNEEQAKPLKTRASKIRAVLFLWQDTFETMNLELPQPTSPEDVARVFEEHRVEISKRTEQIRENLRKAREILETL